MKTAWISIASALALVSQTASAPQPISLTLREGTSMAAALSPDGRTLMIDLQGSLWTLPATGGPAKRVTDEYLDARQPAWAPDNRRVAFQGYADGVWHHLRHERRRHGLRAITTGRSTIASRPGRATAPHLPSRRIDPATTTSGISMSRAARCAS